MNGDEVQTQEIQELVVAYVPRDAVQVLEDLRVAQSQMASREPDSGKLLGTLSGYLTNA